jgi:single-strand DNA-binding protein
MRSLVRVLWPGLWFYRAGSGHFLTTISKNLYTEQLRLVIALCCNHRQRRWGSVPLATAKRQRVSVHLTEGRAAMATTVTGKLNKAASQFQAGESTGFGVRLGVKYYDRESKTEQWCNYEAVVFAKAPAQIQFYQQALVEGAIIEVSGDKQRIRQFQGANGLSLSIEILDARLGAVFSPQPGAMQGRPQQQAPQQGYNQQAAQPAYNQQPAQQAYNQAPAKPAYNQAPAQPAYNQQPAQQAYNQQPAQPAYNQAPAQQGFNQPAQGGFGQQNRAPMEPTIDFDDDIPF